MLLVVSRICSNVKFDWLNFDQVTNKNFYLDPIGFYSSRGVHDGKMYSASLFSARARTERAHHSHILQQWHLELKCLSKQHLKNVLEFLKFCEAMENEFSQIYRHQKYRQEHLIHLESLLTEVVEGCQHPPHQQSTSSHVLPAQIDWLENVVERIRHTLQQKKENDEQLESMTQKLEKYQARESKLVLLLHNLQNLTTELEGALGHHSGSCDSENINVSSCSEKERTNAANTSMDDDDEDSESMNDIEDVINQASTDLKNYCEYRRHNHESTHFRLNYLRFQRSEYKPLDSFLRLLETELLHLWVREDKERSCHEIKYKSVSTEMDESKPTGESSHYFQAATCSSKLMVNEPKVLDPAPERPFGKPFILVEPFNSTENNERRHYARPNIMPPPTDSSPHHLESRCEEIMQDLKRRSATGYSPHHFYLEKARSILREFDSYGYKLVEQFYVHKYVSVVTAVPKHTTEETLKNSVVAIGYGSSKLEATEMTLSNIDPVICLQRLKKLHDSENFYDNGTRPINLECGDDRNVADGTNLYFCSTFWH